MTEFFVAKRFLDAQKPVFNQVLLELQNGKKRTHWMWFIFPQVSNLAQSDISKYYSLKSRRHAEEFARHPTLGRRLIQCSLAVNKHKGLSAREIFGLTDAKKFCSSMTIFNIVCPEISCFSQALELFYEGHSDEGTLQVVEHWRS